MVRARRPSPGIKPWVGTKISATIIDFGEPLLAQLPPQASREQGEQVFNLIILFWNALAKERCLGAAQAPSCPPGTTGRASPNTTACNPNIHRTVNIA